MKSTKITFKSILFYAIMISIVVSTCIIQSLAQEKAPKATIPELKDEISSSVVQVPKLKNWDTEHADSFIENATIRKEYEKGIVYENNFAIVYIPNVVSPSTNFGFLFPGNNYGYTAPDYYIEFVSEYHPGPSVFIYAKESGLATLDKEDGVKYQCGKILKELSKDLGITPAQVGVLGYSNGGYTALHVGAYLIDEFNLNVPKVTILDMGQAWRKREFLVTAEQAQPMVNAGTKVYHFTRPGETAANNRVQEFLDCGIQLYEVPCKVGGSHADILYYAFASNAIFWAVGDYHNPSPQIYDKPVLISPQ